MENSQLLSLQIFLLPQFAFFSNHRCFYMYTSFLYFWSFYFFLVQSLPTFSDLSFNYLTILLIDISNTLIRYFKVVFENVFIWISCAFVSIVCFSSWFIFLYAWLFFIETLTLKKYSKSLDLLLFRQISSLGMLAISDHLNSDRNWYALKLGFNHWERWFISSSPYF